MASKSFIVLKGPINVFFILNYLNINNQGIWYTFLSLGSISILIELGFNNIITQYIAHEFSHLNIHKNEIKGPEIHLNNLFKVINYSLRVYSRILFIFFIISTLIGLLMFNNNGLNIIICWFFYTLSVLISLIFSFVQSYLVGFGKIKLSNYLFLAVSIFISIITWVLLYLGFNIWSLVFANFISYAIVIGYFYYSNIYFINNLKIKNNILDKIIKTQILKLQYKYMVSWISGYFLFYFLLPFVYKYHGSINAAKLGLTLSVINSINSFSYSIMISNISKFNNLVSRNKKYFLNILFKKYFIQCLILFFLLQFCFLFILNLLNNNLVNRFSDIRTILFIILSQIPTFITGLFSYYLRSYKSEPYYLLSLLSSIINLLLILFYLRNNSIDSYFFIFFIIQIIILFPISFQIFYKKFKH
jgi:hypothetical protein